MPELTAGELRLAEKLDDELPEGWTITVARKVLGVKPDVLCVHPEYGVIIFEVKDWDPSSRDLFVSKERVLVARNHGSDETYRTDDPIEQVLWYRSVLSELFSNIADSKVLITTVVVMTRFGDQDAQKLLRPLLPSEWRKKKYEPMMTIVGADSLMLHSSHWLFPVHRRFPKELERHRRDLTMSSRTWDHICWWVRVPELETERYQPLELDRQKIDFLENRSAVLRRKVRGAVGSGKSILLAARAAQGVERKQKVLIVSFTIALRHWLHLLIVRAGIGMTKMTQGEFSAAVKSRVDRRYLHELARQIALEAGRSREFQSLIANSDSYPEERVLQLVLDIAAKRACRLDYDVVLIDEIQNIDVRWIEAIQQLVKPTTEIVIFGDPTQNIYGKDVTWVNRPLKGFVGRWTDLKGSYRFPPALYPILSDFFERFGLSSEGAIHPESAQKGLFDEIDLVHINCEKKDLSALAKRFLDQALVSGVSPMDIAYLCFYHRDGLELLREIAPEKFKARETRHEIQGYVHVFHEDKEHQSHLKKAFWPMDGEVKLCTVKSFQGWEARFVIIAVSPEDEEDSGDQVATESFRRELYVGLSRIARSMSTSRVVVLNANRSFDEFFGDHFKAGPPVS